MDPAALKAFIRQISKEKNLEIPIIKEAIERAILTASRKNLSQYRDAVANLNMDTGELTVSVTKTIVENDASFSRSEIRLREARKVLKNKKLKVGEEVIVPIDPAEFGRIAAQSARQMVMQQLRDAERQKIYTEYKDRVGHVVTGIVQRFEHRDVIMNIGKTEGIMPYNEQPSGARYRANDRLKVMIVRVEMTPRGPQIVLSRRTPRLLIELFKQEVPEIMDDTVQIVGIAREAGVRTKIAVKSTNSAVDPVGACVGMKGSRVQMVVRELENEKIDIVPWSAEPRTYVASALNPAKIINIELDEANKQANVIVAQGNLAIAIGRKGQNTKLAAKLTGFRLNIRSENEDELAYEEIQRRYLQDFLGQIQGMSELGADGLLRSSYNSVEKIASIQAQRLLPFTADDTELAEKLVAGAQEYLVALRQMEEDRRKAREAAKIEKEKAESADAAGESAEDKDSEKADDAEKSAEDKDSEKADDAEKSAEDKDSEKAEDAEKSAEDKDSEKAEDAEKSAEDKDSEKAEDAEKSAEDSDSESADDAEKSDDDADETESSADPADESPESVDPEKPSPKVTVESSAEEEPAP